MEHDEVRINATTRQILSETERLFRRRECPSVWQALNVAAHPHSDEQRRLAIYMIAYAARLPLVDKAENEFIRWSQDPSIDYYEKLTTIWMAGQ